MYFLTYVIVILTCFYQICNTYVIVNSFDNSCNLNHKLVNEISSYKNVTQQIISAVTNEWGMLLYEKYTEFIDRFGARVSGSQVLEDSIDHMINLTVANGLLDILTEEVDVPHWVRGEESLQMLWPRKKKLAILGLGSSVPTPPEGITAQAIVIDSFQELDQMETSQVEGKIVIFNAKFTNYADTVVYRTQGASRAAKKGAVAMLVRSITPFSIYTPHTGAQYYEQNVTKIPAAAITLEDVDLLKRLQDQCEDQKIVLQLKMSNTFDLKQSRNTLINLKGRVDPTKMVIVSGHIDSWDVGQGAMDDGGGMMISWVVPVILNRLRLKPRRTIRAILWTAEEPGLVGAAAYLQKHINELPNINFIMESDEGTFRPLGLDVGGSKAARCIIAEILTLFSPTSKMKESDAPGSDIALFVNKGVPGASLLNDNERYFWYHHTEADTMDVQTMNDVINCAAFWTAVSYVIADLSVDIPRH